MSHFRNECKHGAVIAQCRCPGPKTVNVIDPCPFFEHAVPRPAEQDTGHRQTAADLLDGPDTGRQP